MAINDKNIIKDDFWLNIAAEEVYDSFKTRNDAIERLQKLVVWIIGIYSSVSIASVLYAKPENWNQTVLVLFGTAFIFLIAGYVTSTIASMPHGKPFFANEVSDIRDAYNRAIRCSKRYLTSSISLIVIGSGFYGVAIFLLFSFKFLDSFSHHTQIKDSNSTHIFAIVKKHFDPVEKSFTFLVSTSPNSWNSFYIVHDSLIKGKKQIRDTLQIKNFNNQKSVWLFADSSGKLNFSLKNDFVYENNTFLEGTKIDTLPGVGEFLLSTIRSKLKF